MRVLLTYSHTTGTGSDSATGTGSGCATGTGSGSCSGSGSGTATIIMALSVLETILSKLRAKMSKTNGIFRTNYSNFIKDVKGDSVTLVSMRVTLTTHISIKHCA